MAEPLLNMNSSINRLLRIRKVLLGRDLYQSKQVKVNRISFGNRYAEWTFCPDNLNGESVIYSFGVGEDISFDLLLMEHFELEVHAFDPSPVSREWLKRQTLPEGFHFYPFGLAGEDGVISFAEPSDPAMKSLRITDQDNYIGPLEKTHRLPVHRLPTILEQLGHNRIDILKMDIEGAEYEVIEDIIAAPVPVYQVLIEFHHRFEHLGVTKTRKAIAWLNDAGYRIFNVSSSGEEISFIKQQGI